MLIMITKMAVMIKESSNNISNNNSYNNVGENINIDLDLKTRIKWK